MTPVSSEVIYQQLTAVAAQAYQFLWRADRFWSGTFESDYRPDLRAGETVAVTTGRGRMIGYLEAVSHSLRLGPKHEVIARTTLTVTRGLYDEAQR